MVKKKNIESPADGSKMSALIDSLKSKTDGSKYGLDTANNLAANWRYIDVCNPLTGEPCLLLEWLLGARGFLVGRMVSIEADQGIGKSSLVFAVYGMAQQTTNAWCFHHESEGAPPPPDYIASLGANPAELALQQPGSIERCMGSVEELTYAIRGSVKKAGPDMECKAPIVHGIDSVSGFGTDSEMDDVSTAVDLTTMSGLGGHARCLARWFRDRGGVWLERNQVLMLMTSQIKDKIITDKTMGHLTAEQKRTILAEKPIRFNASIRLGLRTHKLVDDNKVDIGELVVIKTEKNKISPKNREVQIPLWRGKGFQFSPATIDMLRYLSPIPTGANTSFSIEQKGAWVCIDGKNYNSNNEGKTDALSAIYANTDLLMAIREGLRIRGFGFSFEKNYMLSAEELEDITEPVEPT